jgi:hypothetical protein
MMGVRAKKLSKLCTGFFLLLLYHARDGFCEFRLNSVRSSKLISPNKRSAVRGTAYIFSPQLRKDLNSSFGTKNK